MFDFEELEVAEPFKAADNPSTGTSKPSVGVGPVSDCGQTARVLYVVRVVLDAAPTVVAEAVAAALLQGGPNRVEDLTHARLFVSPPVYAEEFLKEFGKPPMVSHLLADEVANIHAAAFPMGFRPLRTGETVVPITGDEGSGFCVSIRRLWLHSRPELVEMFKALYATGPEPHARIFAKALEQDTDGLQFRRTFMVHVHTPFVHQAVAFARQVGWLSEEVPTDAQHDDLIMYRCTVQAHGNGLRQTEIKHELLESNVFRIREGNNEALAHLGEHHVLWPERTMKLVCYMLEEETRIWAAAQGIDLVEVWRGVRCDEVNKVLAVARFVSTVYNCTPGEGAAAACEQRAGVGFNMLYAKKLAARFRRKRYDGVHGGAPGGDQLDGGQFTDGSVSIRGFALALDRVCRRATPEADIFRRFVDLGAGRGNAVIAAHALFPFRSCAGIEILSEHVEYSRGHACKYRDSEDFYMSMNRHVQPEELFVQGDFLKDFEWSDASVVFCNAVTWPRRLIRDVAMLALRLRPGAVFMLLGFGKFFPAESEVLNAFDFRSDACLVSWVDEPQGIWVYQRR